MEVKETGAVQELLPQTLPTPNIPVSEERESPHPDVRLTQIGGALDSDTDNQDQGADKGSLKELENALEKINKTLEMKNISLNYTIDEGTRDIVVKVIEKSSQKVIRQIPPDEVLRLRGRMRELLGTIYDGNV